MFKLCCKEGKLGNFYVVELVEIGVRSLLRIGSESGFLYNILMKIAECGNEEKTSKYVVGQTRWQFHPLQHVCMHVI